jgi:putative ABC transport system ATP-binding protein
MDIAVESIQAQALVSLNEVTKSYRRGTQAVQVLQRLNLNVPKGDFLALMGPSGSGKSTLLNLLGGMDRPSSGKVIVEGKRIDRLSDAALADWRARHVGFVFQLYHLIPVLSAERNVELPLMLANISSEKRKRRVEAAMALAGLNADRCKHKPSELSGGQGSGGRRIGAGRYPMPRA